MNTEACLNPRPIESIRSMLAQAAAEAGDKIAYRFRHGDGIADVTFHVFREDTLALGEALASLGVSGDHIAMCGENSYDWITVYLTVLQSKGVFVPIDKDLPEDDFLNVLLDSDSRVLFYTKKHTDILLRNLDRLDAIRYFIGIDTEIPDPRSLDYRALLDRGYALRAEGANAFDREHSDPHALKMLVYTSGTTGMAKGVMLTEHNLVSEVYWGLQRCYPLSVGLSVLPYHHTFEGVADILCSIHMRSTLCINENLRTVSRNLLLYKPEFIFLVPAFVEVLYKKIWSTLEKEGLTTAFKAMMKLSNGLRKIGIDRRRQIFKKVLDSFGGNLRQIGCGGAPLRPELGDFFDAIGIPIYVGYGITECSPVVSVNGFALNDWHTCGLPLACCEIRLDGMNAEGDGEICVRGDTVMRGYYKRPDLTEKVLEPEGWFHTGDYGRLNKKGQLMITGRKKNLIVLSNGKNIFPEELEGYLYRIPYLTDALVFGLRDGAGQEIALGAEVYLNEDALKELGITDPEAALARDAARLMQRLPSYKHISRFFLRPIPFEKTTTNKIRRTALLYDPRIDGIPADVPAEK